MLVSLVSRRLAIPSPVKCYCHQTWWQCKTWSRYSLTRWTVGDTVVVKCSWNFWDWNLQLLTGNEYPLLETGGGEHCAASGKVAGSILNGLTGIFHWHNPSSRTVAPGVDSASNRNEYQEYFLEGKEGRCVGLTTLPPSCADCLDIWEP